MYVVVVTIHVKPEFVDRFREAILDNARNTRHEPGNLRFDVVVGADDSARFHLYEVYKTKDDFAFHQTQPHYIRWRDAVTDWMAQPRVATRNETLFYGDGEA